MNFRKPWLIWMRTKCSVALALAAMGCGAALAQSAGFPAKPGLWEMTMTTTTKIALPPEVEARLAAMPQAQQDQMRSMMGGAMPAGAMPGGGGQPMTSTHKVCLTGQTSLDSALNQAQQNPAMKCTFSNRVQTATGASFDMSCPGAMGKATGHTQFNMVDDTHVTSSTHMTITASSNGHTLNSTMDATSTGNFVGVDCGDVKPFTPAAAPAQ